MLHKKARVPLFLFVNDLVDGAHVGDFVVIMGKNGDEFISAEELGELAGSFNYEMICTLMPRVIRTYTDTENE